MLQVITPSCMSNHNWVVAKAPPGRENDIIMQPEIQFRAVAGRGYTVVRVTGGKLYFIYTGTTHSLPELYIK